MDGIERQPGTSHQNKPFQEDHEATMNISSLPFNDSNEDVGLVPTLIEKSIDGENTFEDPDDPDFVLSEDDIMIDDSMNNCSITIASENNNHIVNNVNNNVLCNENTALVNINNNQDNLCTEEALNVEDKTVKRKRKKRPNKLI